MNKTPRAPSVLKQLRELVPKRPLTFSESLRMAELQAMRCREILGIEEAGLPEDAIAAIPRVEVTGEPDLPVSGLAQWHNGRWIVALNSIEPHQRQRFSLAHELFHIINHTTRDHIHPTDRLMSSTIKAEKLADYFAGCLLMPKRHVKRMVGEGLTPAQLAERFDVSLQAIGVRLAQLGLTEPTPRCVRPINSWRRVAKPYQRQLPRPERTVA